MLQEGRPDRSRTGSRRRDSPRGSAVRRGRRAAGVRERTTCSTLRREPGAASPSRRRRTDRSRQTSRRRSTFSSREQVTISPSGVTGQLLDVVDEGPERRGRARGRSPRLRADGEIVRARCFWRIAQGVSASASISAGHWIPPRPRRGRARHRAKGRASGRVSRRSPPEQNCWPPMAWRPPRSRSADLRDGPARAPCRSIERVDRHDCLDHGLVEPRVRVVDECAAHPTRGGEAQGARARRGRRGPPITMPIDRARAGRAASWCAVSERSREHLRREDLDAPTRLASLAAEGFDRLGTAESLRRGTRTSRSRVMSMSGEAVMRRCCSGDRHCGNRAPWDSPRGSPRLAIQARPWTRRRNRVTMRK